MGVSESRGPSIVPSIVGSLLSGSQNKVPLIFGSPHVGLQGFGAIGSWLFGVSTQGFSWQPKGLGFRV